MSSLWKAAKKAYKKWMTFAKSLNLLSTAIIFGGVYLFVVPFFALFAIAIALRTKKTESFWVERKQMKLDTDFFERTG